MSHWSFGWGKQRPCSYWSAQGQGRDETDNSDTDLCCLDLGPKPENCTLTFIVWPLASSGPQMWCVLRIVVSWPCSLAPQQTAISRELKGRGEVHINHTSPELCDDSLRDERERDRKRAQGSEDGRSNNIFYTLKKQLLGYNQLCGIDLVI